MLRWFRERSEKAIRRPGPGSALMELNSLVVPPPAPWPGVKGPVINEPGSELLLHGWERKLFLSSQCEALRVWSQD